MHNNKLPLFLFAFANDRTNDDQNLRALSDERRAIEAALAPAERAGLCEVKVLPNATLGEIFAAFQDDRYRDRIAIFHYGGHANSAELLLERNDRENDPAHKEGLIPLLRNQKALQMVFLNGCSTEKWALALNEAGIPLVAGTFEAIRDEVAQQLSAQFYSGLGQGLPLCRAWDEAIANVKASGDGTMRGFGRRDIALDRFPWDLFQRRGAETAPGWNLPDANQNPLALIPLPEKYQEMPLPNEPFRFLDRYKKEDASIFFGRSHAIRDLYDRLTSPTGSPLILLSGQSGVGKSSLLDAGLLPRLEVQRKVVYIRRSAELGLSGTLHQALQCATDADILDTWRRIEQNEGKALVLILDQAEEAFTRDNGGRLQEMEDFAVLLKQIFADNTQKPKGKLLLGFRKEYEGEIENAVKSQDIDYKYVFLKKLGRHDIVEVVTGLTSQPRLAQKYGLRIEDGLPETIAADLLTDSDTSVAPVLQIILTKLWQNPDNQRYFTHEEYLKLKEDGIFLGDFFRQQMEKLREWEQKTGTDVERSGLALDILNSHVTELGFANSRSLDELKNTYQHRSDVLESLIKQFKELYLLTDAGVNRNALAHDTLAPVVQQEVKNSDRPGQKALRILNGKLANYRRNADKTYIPEDDLALVEQGKAGMRVWVEEEPELIRKSQDRRKSRRQQRLGGLIAFAILICLAAWLGYTNYQQSEVEKYVAQARLEAIKDPTTAMKILQKAISKAPDNPSVLAALNEIWSANEFYERIYAHPLPVKGVILASDSSKLFYSWTEQMVYKWTLDGEKKDSIVVENTKAAALSPDGRFLLVSARSGTLMRLETASFQRNLMAGKPFGEEFAEHLVFAPTGEDFFAALSNQRIHRLSVENINVSKAHFEVPGEVSCMDINQNNLTLLVGYADGIAEEYTFRGQKTRTLEKHSDQVLSFAVSPSDSAIASAGRDAQILFHSGSGRATLALKGHKQRIDALQWSPDGSRLFSGGKDYLIKTWSPDRNLISEYRGHSGLVTALSVSRDGQYFVSASEDKTVRLWKTESKVMQRYGPHEGGVTGMILSKDEQTIFTVSDAGLDAVGETLNDPDFDFDQLLDRRFGLFPRSVLAYDVRNGTRKGEPWAGHKGAINAIASDKEKNMLVTASDDETAIIWKLDGTPEKTLSGIHIGKILSVAATTDGQHIVTAGEDSLVVLWRRDGSVIKRIKQNSLVSTVAFSPKVNLFVTGAYDGSIRFYDIQGDEKSNIQTTNCIESLCFSPDGTSVLIGNCGYTAHLYNLQGKELAAFSLLSENKTGGKAIRSVAISPDGKSYALGAEGGLAEIFRLQNSKPVSIQTLQHYSKKPVLFLAFTQDGKGLLTGDGDGWGRWWSVYYFPKSLNYE